MQIVIDISKEKYDKIMSMDWVNCRRIFDEEIRAIHDGKVLPKGHGRLIILSEDAVKREQTPLSFSCQNWISEVGLSNATVAIIEADNESEE